MKRYVKSDRYSNHIVPQSAFIVRYTLEEIDREYETLVYAENGEAAATEVNNRIEGEGYVISTRSADNDDIAEFNNEINHKENQ